MIREDAKQELGATVAVQASSEVREPINWLSAAELAGLIRAGRLSAREVVDAHIKRIEEVNPRLNALVVPLLDQARAAARAADEAQAGGRELGPLHGVPITLKEEFAVAGTPSTFGVQHRATSKAQADGAPAELMRRAGAIVLGKTNVAQLLIYHEADNPVYGRSNNPWALDRTPGGSSGGEAALIAAGASPLGLGSDIGGSIRVPAHFSGIYGLKPTAGRLPSTDAPGHIFEQMQHIVSQPGPLARSVADLALAMSVLAPLEQPGSRNGRADSDWNSYTRIEPGKLRIGMYIDDGYFESAPAVRRAVEVAAGVLTGRGAQVVEWRPPAVTQAMRVFFGLFSADGGAGLKQYLGSSKVDRRTAGIIQLSGLSGGQRRALLFLLRHSGQHSLAELVSSLGTASPAGAQGIIESMTDYRRSFLAEMDRARLDAIICPPHALAALTHGSTYYLGPAASYSQLYNVLGMPAGVVPVSRVHQGEESKRSPGADMVQRKARSVEQGSTGLPVGVQVAARHWREDLVLAVMAALESLRSQADFPARPPL